MLSGNMFELVAYCVAYYWVSCFISMLCHLAFSSNILDDWYPARECYWPILWPGYIVTWMTWMTLGRLTYIWHCASTWVFYLGHRWLMAGRQDVGLFFCFRHTSDLIVWSWYIVNNKLMIWKIVLGLHSDRTTHIFLDRTLYFIAKFYLRSIYRKSIVK